MIIKDSENLHKRGVYCITHLSSGKVYIGSTFQTYQKRAWQHSNELKNGKHKNPYLQNSYNKYGSLDFEIKLIEEVCSKLDLLEKETFWINHYQSFDLSKGFNINKLGTGGVQFPEDVIARRAASSKLTHCIGNNYYKAVKSGDILFDDVPLRYQAIVKYRLQNKVWNKGLTKNEIDYSHLKVPKTKTEAYYQGRVVFKEKIRTKGKKIYVFSSDNKLVGIFRCAPEIQEYSIENPAFFPFVLKNIKGRNGKHPCYIHKQNVINCCHNRNNGTNIYKGLYFYFETDELAALYSNMEVIIPEKTWNPETGIRGEDIN